MVNRDVQIEVALRLQDLASREMKQFERQVDRSSRAASKDLEKVDKSARGIPRSLKLAAGAAIAFYGAFRLGKATLGGGFGFVEDASRAEEALSKFSVVFGEEAGRVSREIDAYAKVVGRSRTALIEFTSGLQDTFVPLGLSRKAAADLSLTITALGTDVASFSNKLDSDVIRDFTSALVGEAEPVRKYGININAAKTEAEAFRLGLVGADGAVSDLAKTAARASLIIQGTTDAQGDAARTSDSWANTVKRLQSAVQELRITAGEFVRDELLKIIQGFGGADALARGLAAGFAFAAQATVSFARTVATVAKVLIQFVNDSGGIGKIITGILEALVDVEFGFRRFVTKIPGYVDKIKFFFRELQVDALLAIDSILKSLEGFDGILFDVDFSGVRSQIQDATTEAADAYAKLGQKIRDNVVPEARALNELFFDSVDAKAAVGGLVKELGGSGPALDGLAEAAGRALSGIDGAQGKFEEFLKELLRAQQEVPTASQSIGKLAEGFLAVSPAAQAAVTVTRKSVEAIAAITATVFEDADGQAAKLFTAIEASAVESAKNVAGFLKDIVPGDDEIVPPGIFDGAKAAAEDYFASLSDGSLGYSAAASAFTALEGGIDQFSTALANGEKDFSRFAESLLKQLAQIAIKTLLLKSIGGIFGGAGVGKGEGASGGIFGGLFAKGGIGPGPLVASGPLPSSLPIRAYANGGIATSPQIGIFGEGRSNEAFVPLPDGKRIPVSMEGGGGGMTVNLRVDSIDPKRASDVILENMPQIQAQLAAAIQSGSDRKLVQAVGRG